MATNLNEDFKNYIDTIALKEQIFFKDSGYKIMNCSYTMNREMTGLEWVFDYVEGGQKSKEVKLNMQTSIYGGRKFVSSKAFVKWFGFHLQITAPPQLYRQQSMNYKQIQPVKCSMVITIPSLVELYKSELWGKYIAGKGTKNNVDDVNGYLNEHINLRDLNIMKWNAKNHKIMMADIKRDMNSVMSNPVDYKDMELSQLDMCINRRHLDVATIYNLLCNVGQYGSKNLKMYHNNVMGFDAELTTGNYKDRETLINKTAGYISKKANGLEFRRGSKSSQVVKFYDYVRKGQQIQWDNYFPIYLSTNNKQAIEHQKKYYGRTANDIADGEGELRYEVSIRNITGGNKGVKELYKKTFNSIEEQRITIQHLLDKKYSSIVRTTLKQHLYNIFGDVITDEMQELESTMNKWDLVKSKEDGGEGFQKGLQIMAILQLMDGGNGMTLQQIKKKCMEMGASYETIRRLYKTIKDEGYASNWNKERIVAMNVIKEIYESLDKVRQYGKDRYT